MRIWAVCNTPDSAATELLLFALAAGSAVSCSAGFTGVLILWPIIVYAWFLRSRGIGPEDLDFFEDD